MKIFRKYSPILAMVLGLAVLCMACFAAVHNSAVLACGLAVSGACTFLLPFMDMDNE